MLIGALVAFLLLAFFRASIWSWLLAMSVIVPVIGIQSRLSADIFQIVIVTVALVVPVLGIPVLRRLLVTRFILNFFRKTLPTISQTEQEALV